MGDASSKPARIQNEYSLFLPGEREALSQPPLVDRISRDGVALSGGRSVAIGASENRWKSLAITSINGADTAILEKHATYRGAIAYVTQERGVIALIPMSIGQLSSIRPRPIAAPSNVRLERLPHFVPGPDVPGNYILHFDEDPSYENVAALGAEVIGWTLAGSLTNEARPVGAGQSRSSRTFLIRSSRLNGFVRNALSVPGMPFVANSSAVYPEV